MKHEITRYRARRVAHVAQLEEEREKLEAQLVGADVKETARIKGLLAYVERSLRWQAPRRTLGLQNEITPEAEIVPAGNNSSPEAPVRAKPTKTRAPYRRRQVSV